ncbi:hypothetical protein V1281_003487 [Nitrobacteraceae bacterium AZCC 2161]
MVQSQVLSMLLLIFNPVWATFLAIASLVFLAWLLSGTALWKRGRYWALAILLAFYAVDTGFALPRVLFAHGLSAGPVVTKHIPLPAQLTLVDVPCPAKCHEMLISGAVDEIVIVKSDTSDKAEKERAVRYRAGWTTPGACPYERQKSIANTREVLLWSGYCPLVESVDAPVQGIFVVHERMNVTASQHARAFTPKYLSKSPPGAVIQFAGVEVQNRSATGTAVLASAYRYFAPGILGLPPLIGCWERPDNVIWIMPPGDTGCGFWRWFTGGGDEKATNDLKWIFDGAFGPPDRSVVPPQKPELVPPTPAEALEILTNIESLEEYLPGLRNALVAPSNSDEAVRELVLKRSRRGNLEGSLITLLATNRISALTSMPEILTFAPFDFRRSGAVIDEMEKNTQFRDQFADTVFLALAARWPSENIDRFFKLMQASDPRWLCNHLHRVTEPNGILNARKNRAMKNSIEAIPPFIPLLLEKTAQQCPDATIELLQKLPTTTHPNSEKEKAKLALRICETLAQSDAQNPAAFRNGPAREFCRI